MPLIRRNYRDLSPELRREGAKAVRDQIMAALRSPGLDPAQMKLLRNQLQKINAWEAGELGQQPPGQSLNAPTLEDLRAALLKGRAGLQ